MRRIILSLLAITTALTALAQDPAPATKTGNSWIWGPSIGYQYQRGSFFKLSGWGLFEPNDHQYMKIDAGANLTHMMGKTHIIPEIGFTYYLGNVLAWPFLKVEATPYTITPKVGVSLMSMVDLGFGYGIDVNQKSGFKKLDGFTTSLNINVPLNFFIR